MISRQRHRVTNWAEYDTGLRPRGRLTVWFTEEAIEGWRASPRTARSGQPCYSDLAIATALTLRAVFHLALRQTWTCFDLVERRWISWRPFSRTGPDL
jgi:hypothetical protein